MLLRQRVWVFGEVQENVVDPYTILLYNIKSLFFWFDNPVINELLFIANLTSDWGDAIRLCYVVVSITSHLFAHNLPSVTGLHIWRECCVIGDVLYDLEHAWSSHLDIIWVLCIECPNKTVPIRMEIKHKLNLSFLCLQEISKSSSLWFREWLCASIEFSAGVNKAFVHFPRGKPVSVEIDTLVNTIALRITFWTHVLSFIYDFNLTEFLEMIFLNKCEAINIHYWYEVKFVLGHDFLHRWVGMVNNAFLNQMHDQIQVHLYSNQFSWMSCSGN